MIRLSLLTAPVEKDLSSLYPGFKVTLRRLTSPEIAEAGDAALAVLKAAREGFEALAPYGLDQADASGRRLNPADVNEMARAGRLVGAVELAFRALQAWEGVTLEDGALAPISRETLAILLQDAGVERTLLREIELAARILVTEGNGSGSSPTGSSAMRPGTAAERTTAPSAGLSAKGAPAVAGTGAAGPAPKRRTARRPLKARPSGAS